MPSTFHDNDLDLLPDTPALKRRKLVPAIPKVSPRKLSDLLSVFGARRSLTSATKMDRDAGGHSLRGKAAVSYIESPTSSPGSSQGSSASFEIISDPFKQTDEQSDEHDETADEPSSDQSEDELTGGDVIHGRLHSPLVDGTLTLIPHQPFLEAPYSNSHNRPLSCQRDLGAPA